MQLEERIESDARPDDQPTGPARPAGRRRGRRAVAVVVVLAVVLGVVGVVRYADVLRRSVQTVAADDPRSVTDRTVLPDLWRAYTATYLEPGTHRTLDPQNGGITTSEGESYTMLRAVWSDDMDTFSASWQWTKDNLQRDDHLMSWKFGQRSDGTYGIQDNGGVNAAADADADIAYALLMAYSRWKQDSFLYDALPIISSLWDKEVVEVGGAPVLVADDLERLNTDRVLVNPSYFAPYAYRVFAKVDHDPTHNWLGLVDNSYTVLEDLAQQPLDTARSAGLPPDWVSLNRRTGRFSPVSDTLTTHFGYEALRLPWRLALDERWYGEKRARELLEGEAVLGTQWTSDHRLAAVYDHAGTPAVDYAGLAMYGGAMGYFDVVRPALAKEVYADELLPVYDPNTGKRAEPLGYYDSNWVWFGMALHLDALPNLTKTDG